MSAEMSGEQMQAKIAAARRDAEGLKDRIKRKKDELADTSRKSRIHTSRPDVALCTYSREPPVRHDGQQLTWDDSTWSGPE